MKHVMTNQWNKFKKSRQGAALLMVLLVSVFVVMMGSSVLFTSSSGYLVQLVARGGANTFYSTEEMLDSVKAGVQNFASEALIVAYTEVMSEYSSIVTANESGGDVAIQEAAQDKFINYFLKELDAYGSVSDGSGGYTDGFFNFDTSGTTGTDRYQIDSTTNEMSGGGTFDPSYLAGLVLLTDGDGNVIDLSGSSILAWDSSTGAFSDSLGKFHLETDENGQHRLVLGTITVTHTTDEGYEINITTDIVIEMPIFVHTGEASVASITGYEALPIENAATIGKYWVKVSQYVDVGSNALLVDGDIYAGTFFTYNENTNDSSTIKFSHGGGRLITHSDTIFDGADGTTNTFQTGTVHFDALRGIEVRNGTVFYTRNDSEIWSSGVFVDGGSDLFLQGNYEEDRSGVYTADVSFGGVNVAGDLYVEGGGKNTNGTVDTSTVALTGDFFGFGYATGGMYSHTNYSDAELESAIVIDGKDVNFIMNYEGNKLRTLALAGTTYLTPGRVGAAGSDYQLGQSIATLPDQIAYLVPPEALSETLTNPYTISNTDSASGIGTNVTVDTSHVLWDNKTLASYGIKSNPYVIIRSFANGQSLVYCFYDFSGTSTAGSSNTRVNSSAYFEDYVTHNADLFKDNLNQFVTMDTIAAGFSNMTAGAVYYMGDDGVQLYGAESNLGSASLSDGDTLYGKSSKKIEEFKNASITLWPDIVPNDTYSRQWVIDATTDEGGWVESTTKLSIDNPFDYYLDRDNIWTFAQAHSSKNVNIATAAGSETVNSLVEFREIVDPTKAVGDEDRYGDALALFRHAMTWGQSSVSPSYAVYPEAKMLVSTAGTQVHEEFEGLIMDDVGIALHAPIISSSDGVNEAMEAVMIYDMGDGVLREMKLGDFFRNMNWNSQESTPTNNFGENELNPSVNWGAGDLVYYENWERH